MQTAKKSHNYLEVFLIGFVIALSFILPYMIIDKGPFLYYGDYSVQQIPFISLMHDSIRSGSIFWSWFTDLGSNFWGSYAFYDLGSPFFWLTLPFPNWLVPYTIGPILCIKIGMMGMTAYAYIDRFVRTRELAMLGGLLYALSSFSIYNIFFNHFHDVMAFFPLLLIALEELMQHNRKGVFALTVFISAFINYFFFIQEVVFLFIYWIIRSLSDEWELSFKKFFTLVFESILGVGLSAVIFLPAVLQVNQNSRTKHYLTGWNLLIYGWNQRLPDIIHSIFIPQDVPAFPNFFPDSGANWSSVSAWLPLFSVCGVIAYILCKKGSWLKRILVTSFVMALIPGLNSLFTLEIDSYYGRWFFMPILMMCLATALALDDPEVDFYRGFKWTAFFSLAFILVIGLIPQYDDKGNFQYLGLFKYHGKWNSGFPDGFPNRFVVFSAVVIGSLIAAFILYTLFRHDKVKLANYSTIVMTIIVCIFGNYFISLGKTFSYDSKWYENVALNGQDKITLDKTNGQYDYRVDVLNGTSASAMDNMAMFWRIPTMQAFNSVVSGSIMDFYPAIGVTRDVASRPDATTAGIRPLLSVKYLFDYSNGSTCPMPGYVRYGSILGYTVWKNTNYIPYGFTYDNYITQNQFNTAPQKDRILLKGMLLNSAQIKKYGNLMTPIAAQSVLLDYSDDQMSQDCAALHQHTCTNFHYDNAGFGGNITLDKSNLVFFSVPYDSGWSATVNGKPAAIEKVDIGFMAIKCGQGANVIRFNYTVPGLKSGLLITIVSILVFAAYVLLFFYKFKKRPVLFSADPGRKIHYSYEAEEPVEVNNGEDFTWDLPPKEANTPPEQDGDAPTAEDTEPAVHSDKAVGTDTPSEPHDPEDKPDGKLDGKPDGPENKNQ